MTINLMKFKKSQVWLRSRHWIHLLSNLLHSAYVEARTISHSQFRVDCKESKRSQARSSFGTTSQRSSSQTWTAQSPAVMWWVTSCPNSATIGRIPASVNSSSKSETTATKYCTWQQGPSANQSRQETTLTVCVRMHLCKEDYQVVHY